MIMLRFEPMTFLTTGERSTNRATLPGLQINEIPLVSICKTGFLLWAQQLTFCGLPSDPPQNLYGNKCHPAKPKVRSLQAKFR